MLNKLQKRKTESSNQGFTIIEVMIVLAIAGLILLIVFLAVPALQRNARNTTIKNDASVVGGAITTFQSDNNGSIPNSISGTGTVTITNAAGTSETAKVNGATAVTTVATQPTAAIAAGTLQVYIGKTCPVAQGGSGQTSTRAFSIFYSVETSGAPTLQCLDT